MKFTAMTVHVTAWMVWVVLAARTEAAEATDDAQRVFARVSPSVVTVRTLGDNGKPESQGSGVVVGRGLVATNCHVVQEAATIRIVATQGELPATWSRQLPGLDLCLLTVTDLNAASLPLRPSTALVVGEPIYAVGNPLDFGLAVSAGLIALVEPQSPYPLIVATAPLSPGSSGGGIFDREGRLLGITTAILGTGQNLNRILAADAITDLLTRGAPRPAVVAIPAPERRWNDEAERLQAAGDWIALEKHAQVWMQAQPGSVSPVVFEGIAQAGLKRETQAAVTLRRASVLDEHSAFAWLSLANVLFRLGQLGEAEQALRQAERKQPSYGEPHRVRAEWLQKQGQAAQALVQVKEALRKAPARSAVWVLLGRIEDDLGHGAEATRAYNTALRLGSADTEVKQRLAALSAQSGNPDAALRQGVLTDASNEQQAYALVNIGRGEVKRGRLGPAEDAFRKALAQAPRYTDALNELGNVLQRTQRFAEAEEIYTQAIAVGPEDAGVISNRASARQSQKKWDLALVDARRAIDVFPENAAGWRAYGNVQFALRDHREASRAFAQLDGLTPLNPDDLTTWADSLLGTDDLEGAFKALQRAEAKDPRLVRMCLVMARFLGRKGDIQGALDYENRALATDPVNSIAWSGKGYALMKLGKLPEAAEALETAVRLDPELSNAWINLGEVRMRNRNLGAAIQALEKAVTLAPTAMDARLFLAQSYLGARLPAKSREQAEKVLGQQANFAPALGVLTLAYLIEGNTTAASARYLQLRTLAPSIARKLREQAIAGGLAAATQLPE